MKSTVEISEDVSRRIDRLAERKRTSRSRIVEDALTHGRSLSWQEKWIAGVEAGLDDAEHGRFASDEDVAAVLGKFKQA